MGACTICSHPKVEEIDAALVRGESRRRVADWFHASESALQRHRTNCISPALVTAHAKATEEARYRSLLDRIEEQATRLERVIQKAEDGGSTGTMLSAIRELRAMLELLGKATGELKPDGTQVTVNIATSEEWQRIQAVIVGAVTPFPEARAAVGDALMALGTGHE
ncbi:MAG: hypothetical protein KY454_09310 [Actinobacteria bacterium]|nr:hypothetical protein [Actinomycetota bacterium]